MLHLLLLLLLLLSCKGGADASSDTGTLTPLDVDGDGFDEETDCDDADPLVHPDAVEVCDGVDNDCDGSVDVGAVDAPEWHGDVDGDGWGTGERLFACQAPSATVLYDETALVDCDDSDALVHPGQTEICWNGVDDDCDGLPGDCRSGTRLATDAYAVLDGVQAGTGHGQGSNFTIASVTDPNYAELADLNDDGVADFLVGNDLIDAVNYPSQNAGRIWFMVAPAQGSLTLDSAAPSITAPDDLGVYACNSYLYARALGVAMAIGGDRDEDGVGDIAITGPGVFASCSEDYDDEVQIYFGPFDPGNGVLPDPRSPDIRFTFPKMNGFGSQLVWGDYDGDEQRDDLIIGAYAWDYSGSQSGAVLLTLGGSRDEPDLELGVDHVVLSSHPRLALGRDLNNPGDLDGNGVDELVVSTGALDDERGGFYLWYNIDDSSGQPLSGSRYWTGDEPDNHAGGGRGIGDFDWDGYPEVLIADSNHGRTDFSHDTGVGRAWHLEYDPERFDECDEGWCLTYVLVGVNPLDGMGFAHDRVGDVDGDGFEEVLASRSPAATSGPEAWLIFGNAEGEFASDGPGVVQLTPPAGPNRFGYQLVGLGDITGDAYPDWAIVDIDGNQEAGQIYLFSGAPL